MKPIIKSIYPVACHTDHVGLGSTFVAIKGMKDDGIHHIVHALHKGATSIVVDEKAEIPSAILDEITCRSVTLHKVSNTRRALAHLSAQALDFPAKKLRIVGVTGTKGKTTTSFLLEHIFSSAGYKTALISSVYNKIGTTLFDTSLTTPQPDYIHMFFDACVQTGVDVVIMEVAAQALSLDRVYGIDFDGVIFTNFDLEHSEFYPSLDDYFKAKCLIFAQTKPQAPRVVNGDDQWCQKISQLFLSITTCAFHDKHADTSADVIDTMKGVQIFLPLNDCMIECPILFGHFNAYNVLMASTLAKALGISYTQIQESLKTFLGVPGRLQMYTLPNGSRCCIDKAHNPSSYRAVLGTLRSMTNHLIVVFGAGGERDTIKRPIMGTIASEFADMVILTSDDPRSEDPEIIIQDILAGISQERCANVFQDIDREFAIKKAYEFSKPGSIIALLGKGDDEYQLIRGVKNHFSEREIIASLS